MVLHFQALAFLQVGKKSVTVLRSGRAHLDFAVAMISPELFSLPAKAPSSLSIPTRCNRNSSLLHQHVPSQQLYPQVKTVLFHKQGKVQVCKKSIRPRFRTGSCCERNLGTEEVSNSSWLTGSLHRLPRANHSHGCLDLRYSQAAKFFLVRRG